MSLFESADALIKDLNESAPFLSFAARFASFKKFVYDKRINAKCTSMKLVHAGFYSTGDSKNVTAKCPFCSLELAFKQLDDPWEMHIKNSPNCDYVMLGKPDEYTLPFRTVVNLALRCATISKYEEILEDIKILEEDIANRRDLPTKNLVSFRNDTHFLSYERRLESFESVIIDKKKIHKIRQKSLASAGFHSTASSTCPSSATCSFCQLTIDFNTITDVWNEHQRLNPECDFVRLDKREEKLWTPEEGLMLAARISIVKTYSSGLKLVSEFEKNEKEYQEFGDQVNRLIAKPKYTRRCSV